MVLPISALKLVRKLWPQKTATLPCLLCYLDHYLADARFGVESLRLLK